MPQTSYEDALDIIPKKLQHYFPTNARYFGHYSKQNNTLTGIICFDNPDLIGIGARIELKVHGLFVLSDCTSELLEKTKRFALKKGYLYLQSSDAIGLDEDLKGQILL